MTARLLPIWSLWSRELIRFVRQRNRVIGALGPPILVWFFIGSGFGSSFRGPGSESGVGYLEYLYPGIITLVVLFTAIFSSISVIEDRREGFLNGVLVTPISRSSIVLGKMLGGSSQAFIQGCLLLALAPFLGMSLSPLRVLTVLLALGVVALSTTALGFATAWGTDSTQGYHAIMNMLLMPMWMLSGAFFPLSGAPRWLHTIMLANPMTYGLSALRGAFYGDAVGQGLAPVHFGTALAIVAGFGGAMFGVAVMTANRAKP
ncbi:multidrug ABC transporter permease [Candidatus Poribacteria bacterium]|nr:multidrug ABC transporter permease [Candidatus Poribacteria bacterium]